MTVTFNYERFSLRVRGWRKLFAIECVSYSRSIVSLNIINGELGGGDGDTSSDLQPAGTIAPVFPFKHFASILMSTYTRRRMSR